jgi:hypothetical protein
VCSLPPSLNLPPPPCSSLPNGVHRNEGKDSSFRSNCCYSKNGRQGRVAYSTRRFSASQRKGRVEVSYGCIIPLLRIPARAYLRISTACEEHIGLWQTQDTGPPTKSPQARRQQSLPAVLISGSQIGTSAIQRRRSRDD